MGRDKTKQQLIAEIRELRRQNAKLREADTGRAKAEKEASHEQDLMQTLLNNIPDYIYFKDRNRRFVRASNSFCDLLKCNLDDIIGKTDEELFPEEISKETSSDDRRVIATGIPIINKAEGGESIGGEEHWVLTTKIPWYDREGKIVGLFGISREVTERKQMEEELLRAQKLESLGVLAGGIAHDLNNLLTGVVGNISFARLCEDPKKKDERLAEAEKASIQIKDLTHQLLTFSKGGAPIRQMTAIGDLLRDSATFTLRGSNVGCDFAIADGLWPAEVDEGQISQLINNLVLNAQQAMPEGGRVKVSAENITVGAELDFPLAPGAYIRISIEDLGVGIQEEHLQRIFDPFFTTKHAGSGLGLATSYAIIQKHNGYITAESQVGVGTTFHVQLPASPEAALVGREKEEKILIMGAGRVLVMDDEKKVRETAGEMLHSLGYRVATATDGSEALGMYKQAMESDEPFHAVIVDLTVPGGMGGRPAMQKLVELDPDIKAIVSSGYSNDPIMADFGKHGFRGVLAKPYNTSELSEVLRRVIGDR